jgi:hypothetical protein
MNIDEWQAPITVFVLIVPYCERSPPTSCYLQSWGIMEAFRHIPQLGPCFLKGDWRLGIDQRITTTPQSRNLAVPKQPSHSRTPHLVAERLETKYSRHVFTLQCSGPLHHLHAHMDAQRNLPRIDIPVVAVPHAQRWYSKLLLAWRIGMTFPTEQRYP